jgi:peptidyl-prolyl cis-trans isomerase D
MLERIREGSQGIAAKIILGVVIVSFAIAGVSSSLGIQGSVPVAEVNGVEIAQTEYVRAYQNERNRMQQQFGEFFEQLAASPGYMEGIKSGVLDRLVEKELSQQLADELGLFIGDDQIKQAIIETTAFHVDGKFDNDRYLQTLARAGYTPSKFREIMREDMLTRQLLVALTNSEFSLDNEAAYFAKLQNQTRDIEYAEVSLEQFKQGVTAEQDELEASYQENIDRYQTPEQVSLSYINLTVDDLVDQITVSDEEIQQQYDASPDAYKRDERRRASHILIGSDDKAKADDLLAQIKGGADFAELAKTHSEDTFSGEKGGDLDFFARGVMTSEFEDAAFALVNKGDVSDVVESEFGFHIIKLTDIEAESIQPLSEVKETIAVSIKREKANILFGEKQQLIADLAFEISDSLEDAAAEAGVKVETTPLFSAATAPAIVNNK